MSLDVESRMLWHDTNYLGKYVQGCILGRESLNEYPVALSCAPRLTLDFGAPAKIARIKINRIPVKEHHFSSQKPPDIIWDLYFVSLQPGDLAWLVLVPRGVLDSPSNGITLHAEALYRLKWKYLGTLESSTFRWDLHLLLQEFFGTPEYPHCKIEAFLPFLENPRPQRDGKNERVKESCWTDKDKVHTTKASSNELETILEAKPNQELFPNRLPQPSTTIKSIPKENSSHKKLQQRRNVESGKKQEKKARSQSSTTIKSIPKENESSIKMEQNRKAESGGNEEEKASKGNRKRNKHRGKGKKKAPLANSSNA